MNKNVLIIYHSEDNDGRVSGALCRLAAEERFSGAAVTCYGRTYAQLTDWLSKFNSVKDFITQIRLEYDTIILTDISFNEVPVMNELYKEFNDNFYWFDHHTPAVKSSFYNGYNNAKGIRVNGEYSAIRCVWEYFFDNSVGGPDCKNTPKLLNTLSAYDSWNWAAHGTTFDFCNYVNKGFNVESCCDFEKTYNIIKVLLANLNKADISVPTLHEQQLLINCYTTGRILAVSEDINNKDLINRFGDYSFTIENGDKCCALFNQSTLNSSSFKSLKNTDTRHGIVFKRLPATGKYVISLYNINNDDMFNCGDYLKKKYNGGEHIGAAGTTVSKTVFNNILKSKVL